MATPDDNAKWLQTPQNLAVLLQDRDTKAAIIDYIHAATRGIAPEKDWREVWYQETDYERNFHIAFDRATGVENREWSVIARLDVHFSESQHVAKLEAYVRPKGSYWRLHLSAMQMYALDEKEVLFVESVPARNYADAIRWGQSRWADVVAWFHSKTSEIAENVNV